MALQLRTGTTHAASPRTDRPGWRAARAIAWLAAVPLAAATTSPARAAVDAAQLRAWGLATAAETDRTLRVPGTLLYAETASLNGTRSGGANGRAYVWPTSTQFRVLNSLTQLDPATYAPVARSFSDQMYSAYWNNGYRSGAGTGDRFYDDNAHVVVALAEAYRLTRDSTYLDRAKAAEAFVLSGEDAAAGGGIYFKQNDFSSKDAISTLQGARGAAMLYRLTGQQSYLTDATRLITWANTHIRQSNGLFYQGWSITGNGPSGVEIVNSAGIGISTNLELYDATGNAAYLAEAKRIGNASIGRYFDAGTGRINDEGFWAFELVDGFDNLYAHDGNPLWLNKVYTALGYLHDRKQDPNGHYDTFWGRNGPITGTLTSWDLNEMAPVARAYLYTAAVPEPATDGVAVVVVAVLLMSRRRAGLPCE